MAFKFASEEEARQFLNSRKYMVNPNMGIVPKTTTLNNYPRTGNHVPEPVAVLSERSISIRYENENNPVESSNEFKNARRKLENMLETEVALGHITKE